MIPIGAPVTATNPSGEKIHGILEGIDLFDGEWAFFVRDGHDFDYKWFLENEVKIRVPHYTISRPFTLWQLNALIEWPANDWDCWENDALKPNEIHDSFGRLK